jgi:hypothetical protein
VCIQPACKSVTTQSNRIDAPFVIFQSKNVNCRINNVHNLFSTLVDLMCPGGVPSGGERALLDPHGSGHSDRHHHHSFIIVLHLSRVSIVRKSEVSAF